MTAAVDAEYPRSTLRAFTVVVCSGCGRGPDTPPAEAVLCALGDVVRRCPHGILVSVPCLFGPAFCADLPFDGVVAALQPCTTDRAPTGPAYFVGPIRGPEDAARLGSWVREGRWRVGLLPVHMQDPVRQPGREPITTSITPKDGRK